MAYESDESGDYEIYVQPFPGPGGRWQVSAAGGRFPRWSDDGKRLFYLANMESVTEVPIEVEGSAIRAGRVQSVVKVDPRFRDREHWLVSPDGNRFGFIQGPESVAIGGDGEGHILVRFTYNWFDELRETIGDTR